MSTPFDGVIDQIKQRGFHNHRLEDHSDVVSEGILADLKRECAPFGADFASGKIADWKNVKTPGARNRKIDLLVGQVDAIGGPDLDKIRLCVENKSVVTAHRNRYARFDDLNEALQVLHRVKAEAILIATVIIGVAEKVLNVPDKVKPHYKMKPGQFLKKIVPRLSSGDQKLWKDFEWAVSVNHANDFANTVSRFRQLRTRPPGHTHVVGYDYVMLVPAFMDNVNEPYIPEPNDPRSLGIDVMQDYRRMLDTVCKAYSARWHL